jgi:hypothetical protein
MSSRTRHPWRFPVWPPASTGQAPTVLTRFGHVPSPLARPLQPVCRRGGSDDYGPGNRRSVPVGGNPANRRDVPGGLPARTPRYARRRAARGRGRWRPTWMSTTSWWAQYIHVRRVRAHRLVQPVGRRAGGKMLGYATTPGRRREADHGRPGRSRPSCDRTFTTRARKVPAAVHRGGRNERRRCEATSGGNPWFYRFELAADDRRYPGAKEEFEMPAARQFDVLEVWQAANLQATRQRRADRIALRVNRRQLDAGGKAIVGEVAQKR